MSDTIPFAVSGDLTRLSHELEFVLRTLKVLEHGNPITTRAQLELTRVQLELILIGLGQATAKARKLERLCEETPPPQLIAGSDLPDIDIRDELSKQEAAFLDALKVRARRGDT